MFDFCVAPPHTCSSQRLDNAQTKQRLFATLCGAFFLALLFVFLFPRTVLSFQRNDLPDSSFDAPSVELSSVRRTTYYLGASVEIFADTSRKAVLSDIVRGAYQGKFIRSQELYPNCLNTNAVYWVRMRLRHAEPSPRGQWILDIAYPGVDSVQAFIPSHDSSLRSMEVLGTRCALLQSGASIAPDMRAVRASRAVVPLPEHSLVGEAYTVYLRIVAQNPVHLHLIIFSREDFALQEQREYFFFGLIYGVMIFAFGYNLVIYFITRNRTLLYYLLYVAVTGVLVSGLNGFVADYLWLNIPDFSGRFLATMSVLAGIVGILFGQNFLQGALVSPRLNRALNIVMLLQALAPPFTALNILTLQHVGVSSMVNLWLLVALSVLATKQGQTTARFYMTGWIFYGVIIFWVLLSVFGVTPYHNFWTVKLISIGTASEMVLFSFALASRLRALERSVEGERRRREIGELEFRYKLEKAEQTSEIEHLRNVELAELNAEIETQHTILRRRTADLEEANAFLKKLNEEKNELMNIVSHDLKNPISVFRGFAEMLQAGDVGAAQARQITEQMIATADRMLGLVKNLLDMNRLESGVMQLNIVRFSLHPVVENTLAQYRASAEAKRLALYFENAAVSPSVNDMVLADEQATMQVLDNLISNAVKYSLHGKNIYVRLLIKETTVRVEVQDEGEGISEADMTKLFGKFARLSARPTGGEHSTGLGLSIVKKMVEAMNGRVWCESEAGKGATFIVEFPTTTVE
jgi:signal transduction histidine kinase